MPSGGGTTPGGVWSAWKSLGGVLSSSPGAASYLGRQLYVAVRGSDGACWVTFSSNGGTGWGSWLSYGGQLLAGTGPTVVNNGTYVRYLVTGTDSQLYFWKGSWKSLGGHCTSSPGAASYGDGMLHVAVRGSDGAIWQTSSLNGGTSSWGSWRSYGGQLLAGTGPALVYDGIAIRYLVTGTDHALYWYTGSGWKYLGVYLTSAPAAASHSSGAIDVVARSSDGNLWSRWTSNSGASLSSWYQWA